VFEAFRVEIKNLDSQDFEKDGKFSNVAGINTVKSQIVARLG
jgi:hypothetical protein